MHLAVAPARTDLSELLRAERSRLGGGDPTRFSQPRMADLLGVSLRQYQRWEHGDSTPSSLAVERIRRRLEETRVPPEETETLEGRFESMQAEIRALRAELAELRARR